MALIPPCESGADNGSEKTSSFFLTSVGFPAIWRLLSLPLVPSILFSYYLKVHTSPLSYCGAWFCQSNRGVCMSSHSVSFPLEAESETSAVLPASARLRTQSLQVALSSCAFVIELHSAHWAAEEDQTETRFRRILVRTVYRDMVF
jgi:hypothetical protein